MNRKWPAAGGLLLCGALATLLAQAGEKEEKEKQKPEEYSATAIVSGPGPTSLVQLSIRIESFTPDEEVVQLVQILKEQGPGALAKALDKSERGRIAPVARLGNDINVARAFQTEKGRLIRLVMNRPLGFMELRRGNRSKDYEFSVIELLVDEKGEGQGVAVAAAKIKFNQENQLEVENYGQRPVRLTNIRRH